MASSPAPPTPASSLSAIVLGGGCFWCLEAVFLRLQGVAAVQSGYAGGTGACANYAAVCSGTSGHVEVVRIAYDPRLISLEQLLEVFFATHDPTTRDRQGNDRGSQYRSVIHYGTEEERLLASQVIARQQLAFDRPIVTELLPAAAFFAAEVSHHDYYGKHPEQPYCQLVIGPKIGKLLQGYRELLKNPSNHPHP